MATKIATANAVIVDAYIEMRRIIMENRVFSVTNYNEKIKLNDLTVDNVLEGQAFDQSLETSLLALSEYIGSNDLVPPSSAADAAQAAIETYKERESKKKAKNKAALIQPQKPRRCLGTRDARTLPASLKKWQYL